jgi:hypothetical protein
MLDTSIALFNKTNQTLEKSINHPYLDSLNDYDVITGKSNVQKDFKSLEKKKSLQKINEIDEKQSITASIENNEDFAIKRRNNKRKPKKKKK